MSGPLYGIDRCRWNEEGFVVKKKETIDRKQIVDTGMALVLVGLLLFFLLDKRLFLYIASALLVIDMTVPIVLKPVAFLWFKFSNLLGAVMSRVVLGIVYFLLVCPIGMARRASAGSLTGRGEWKKSTKSVLVTKNHCFKYADIVHPF
jgi:hypothetical protein